MINSGLRCDCCNSSDIYTIDNGSTYVCNSCGYIHSLELSINNNNNNNDDHDVDFDDDDGMSAEDLFYFYDFCRLYFDGD